MSTSTTPGSFDPSWPYWQQEIAGCGSVDERMLLVKHLNMELKRDRDALMQTIIELELLKKHSKDLEEKLERRAQGLSTPHYMPSRASSPSYAPTYSARSPEPDTRRNPSPSPVPAKKSRTSPVSQTVE